MALKEIPRYSYGVTLTKTNGTWYVVTDFTHPYGADVVGYPSYRDAYAAWKIAVEEA